MLDEKDLQAIAEMMNGMEQRMDKKLQTLEQRIDAKLAKQKDEILDESTHRMNVLLETKVQTQLNLLAEGQKTILETLAPKNRVEELEEEVSFLKSVIRLHTDQIAELKKAQ